MTESQKSSQLCIDETRIFPQKCRVCGVETNYVYRIEEGREGKQNEKSTWYRCPCGVIFQKDIPSKEGAYTEDPLKDIENLEEHKLHCVHSAKTYVNLIEELTYGRMMLDVGFGVPFTMKHFEDRGWLVWGIEMNENVNPGGNIYKGDFETYDFSLKITKEELETKLGITDVKERTFDLIWMSNILEHFRDPIKALQKAYNLLSETGVIYISTPDVDFINKTGVAMWSHWNKKEHHILWNERSLCRELERIGFHINVVRRNYASRFSSWYDVHVIAQKNYF